MQIAVIEYARSVAGITDACSGEAENPSKNKVIDFMPGQNDEVKKGGTLRLGSYPCIIKPDTIIKNILKIYIKKCTLQVILAQQF